MKKVTLQTQRIREKYSAFQNRYQTGNCTKSRQRLNKIKSNLDNAIM